MAPSKLRLFLFFVLLAFRVPAFADDRWGAFIPPDYPYLHWNGRVSFRKQIARFDWAEVGFQAKFQASACAIYLNPLHNEFNVFVDGTLTAIVGQKPLYPGHPDAALWLSPGAGTIPVWTLENLGPGPHLLEIDKRTGPNFGIAKFYGLRLDADGRLLPPPPAPKHRIEFIGDSLTNAYGSEAPDTHCKELLPYENAWKSYASITARHFDADFELLALSGYGLVRNFGDKHPLSADSMRDYYPRTISALEGKWTRARFAPDAIVINLGSNDYWGGPFPDSAAFQSAMAGFLQDLETGRPEAPIFLICNLGLPQLKKELLEATRLAKAKGLNVTYLEFDQPKDDEMGCSWHPNEKVQERWAKVLTESIQSVTVW